MASSDSTAQILHETGCTDLPSGHQVSVQIGAKGEEILVTDPQGQVAVRIELTEASPVVTLSSAQLRLEAADTVAVSCRRFEVNAREEATIVSGGTLELESSEEMYLTADADLKAVSPMIWLN